MTKLSIAIAFLAAAVSAGALTHHRNMSSTTVPSITQADFPFPVCPPDCAIPTPNKLPK